MTTPLRKVLVAHPGTTLVVLWLSVIGMIVYLATTTVGTFRDANALVQERAIAYAHLIAAHDKFYLDRAQGLLMEIEDHLTYQDMMSHQRAARRSRNFCILTTRG